MASTINASNSGAGGLISAGDASGVLALQTAGTTAITVDASQNVGISSTPSAWGAGYPTLQVGGGAACLTGRTGTSVMYLGSNWYYDGTNNKYIISDSATQYYQSNGNHVWRYAASGTAGATISAIEAMRIDSSGNLLVGTTGSDGRIAAKGADNSSSNWTIYSRDSSGNPIFGARNDRQVYAGGITATTGTALVLDSSGYIKTLSSSLRYKKDVEPIDIGLDFVLQLNPVKYNLKEGNIAQVGFIAEDFPEKRLVSNSMVDDQDESKGLQVEGVNYAQIVAPLVKAIQEQQALITAQAETINAQSAALAALTARIVALEGK